MRNNGISLRKRSCRLCQGRHWMPRLILFAAIMTVYGANVVAQDAYVSPSTLKKLSVEELVDIDVTSVSKYPEKFSEAAAAVAEPPAGAPVPAVPEPDEADLLGLENIFKDEPAPGAGGAITEEDIDRIADRVIQRLSSQVIESIAWDIVPDITEKIVREELRRIDES